MKRTDETNWFAGLAWGQSNQMCINSSRSIAPCDPKVNYQAHLVQLPPNTRIHSEAKVFPYSALWIPFWWNTAAVLVATRCSNLNSPDKLFWCELDMIFSLFLCCRLSTTELIWQTYMRCVGCAVARTVCCAVALCVAVRCTLNHDLTIFFALQTQFFIGAFLHNHWVWKKNAGVEKGLWCLYWSQANMRNWSWVALRKLPLQPEVKYRRSTSWTENLGKCPFWRKTAFLPHSITKRIKSKNRKKVIHLYPLDLSILLHSHSASWEQMLRKKPQFVIHWPSRANQVLLRGTFTLILVRCGNHIHFSCPSQWVFTVRIHHFSYDT